MPLLGTNYFSEVSVILKVFDRTRVRVDIMVDIKHPKYTYTKNSFFYFSRAVPFDLRNYYSTNRIVISLKTKSFHKAHIASNNISSKLEDYWLGLRLKSIV
jgi:hypothetical protein